MTNKIWTNPETWGDERIESGKVNRAIKQNMLWLYERDVQQLVLPVGSANQAITFSVPVFITGLSLAASLRQVSTVKFSLTCEVANDTIDAYSFFNIRRTTNGVPTYASTKLGIAAQRNSIANYRDYIRLEWYFKDVETGVSTFDASIERTSGTTTVYYDRIPGVTTLEVF